VCAMYLFIANVALTSFLELDYFCVTNEGDDESI
jgi:hypothetical protein